MPTQSSYVLEAKRQAMKETLRGGVFDTQAEKLRHITMNMQATAQLLRGTGAITVSDVNLLGARREIEYALQDIDALIRARNIEQRMAAE